MGLGATGLQLVQDAFYWRLPRRAAPRARARHAVARAARRTGSSRGEPAIERAGVRRRGRADVSPRRRWAQLRYRRLLTRGGAAAAAAFAEAYPRGVLRRDRRQRRRASTTSSRPLILDRDWRGVMVEPVPLHLRAPAPQLRRPRPASRSRTRPIADARRRAALLPPARRRARGARAAARLVRRHRFVLARRGAQPRAAHPRHRGADRRRRGAGADASTSLLRAARRSSASTWSSSTPRATTRRSCGPSTSTAAGPRLRRVRALPPPARGQRRGAPRSL